MNLLNKSMALFALLVLGQFASPVLAAEQVVTKHVEHEAFARSFSQTVLAIIQDTKKSYADRKEVLRTAFANSVDIDWIAKFVLGKTWANATPEQRERYTELYRKFLTETYVSNFAENPDKRIRDIKIYSVNGDEEDDEDDKKDEEKDSSFTVHTEMMLADMENLKVNYLVREEGGKYRVRDIAIENVSLIATHRSEFSAIAVSGGIDSVISDLEQKLRQPKSTISLSMNQ